MDSRLYIHCPILDNVPPRVLFWFFLFHWGGGYFLAIFHVLITYYSRPPPDAFYFLPQGAAVLFFFCFRERWRRTEFEYSSTGKGQKIPNCVFHVSVAFIYFFFSSSDGALATALPFHVKNMCGVICGEFLLMDVQNLPRTHLQKGWLMFIYTRRKEKSEKNPWLNVPVLSYGYFASRHRDWKRNEMLFCIFLQLFRKHKLEISRFWCFVSLIFASSLNISVCVKMWQFKNERCDNFL